MKLWDIFKRKKKKKKEDDEDEQEFVYDYESDHVVHEKYTGEEPEKK